MFNYTAGYFYKNEKCTLRNSVAELEDFKEDFKRHTKEGSELKFVWFTKIENNT